MGTDRVLEFGGDGAEFLLLHGLMGRARTWWPVVRWLRGHGRVRGLDARGHGRHPVSAAGARTEDFVADAAAVLDRPTVVLGHSMGGLHALGLAAAHPDLVRAVVVEDFAPDQRGRTVEPWRARFDAWPVPFDSLAAVREYFGPLGDYFAECFTERADGYHLMASLTELYAIAGEWGERDYWPLVRAVRCPVLVLEPERSAMPPGQLRELAEVTGGRHVYVPDAGHVVHHDAPRAYRAAVESFLTTLC